MKVKITLPGERIPKVYNIEPETTILEVIKPELKRRGLSGRVIITDDYSHIYPHNVALNISTIPPGANLKVSVSKASRKPVRLKLLLHTPTGVERSVFKAPLSTTLAELLQQFSGPMETHSISVLALSLSFLGRVIPGTTFASTTLADIGISNSSVLSFSIDTSSPHFQSKTVEEVNAVDQEEEKYQRDLKRDQADKDAHMASRLDVRDKRYNVTPETVPEAPKHQWPDAGPAHTLGTPAPPHAPGKRSMFESVRAKAVTGSEKDEDMEEPTPAPVQAPMEAHREPSRPLPLPLPPAADGLGSGDPVDPFKLTGEDLARIQESIRTKQEAPLTTKAWRDQQNRRKVVDRGPIRVRFELPHRSSLPRRTVGVARVDPTAPVSALFDAAADMLYACPELRAFLEPCTPPFELWLMRPPLERLVPGSTPLWRAGVISAVSVHVVLPDGTSRDQLEDQLMAWVSAQGVAEEEDHHLI